MIRSYLTIALRNLHRQRGYAFINIAGLALGLACCLLIALFVRHELGYDRFHTNADRIYRLVMVSNGSRTPLVPEIVAPELEETFPEVEQAVRVNQPSNHQLVKVGDQQDYEDGVMTADQDFFKIFSFTPVEGDLDQALSGPGSLVLTRSIGEKYFRQESPIGQSIVIGSTPYTVRAVIENLPDNSSIRFSMVGYRAERPRSWTTLVGEGYVLLRDGVSPEEFKSILSDYVRRSEPASLLNYRLDIQHLSEFHLRPDLNASTGISGPRVYSVIFSGAALLILLIAGVNYMNLATARSMRRAREVGIRKVVGARRSQLAWQFIAESFLTSSLAVILSVLLVMMLLPVFGGIVGVDLSLQGVAVTKWLAVLVGSILFVGILSGSYPALFLSGFQPVHVLRGWPVSAGSASGMRKALVVFQFAASVALVVGSLVVWQQMEYVRAERLNGNDEQIVSITDLASQVRMSAYETFRSELLSKPGIASVTFGSVPNSGFGYPGLDSTGAVQRVGRAHVDYDYVETLGLEMIAGRSFSGLRDGGDQNSIIINEAAARWLQVDDPVGEQFPELHQGTVVGVVRDFHMLSLHEPVYPLILDLTDDEFIRSAVRPTEFLVRLEAGQLAEGLASMTETWETLFPDYPMSHQFLDERLDQIYRAELRMGRLFGWFSATAILIACLGLFGLAAYTAERRTKEIGIRKVLGASVSNLVTLLSKDFIRLVLIAFVVAVPIAWIAMNQWLEDFAYRIEIGPGIFLLAGGMALLIALATVSYQAVKAALADPVKSLRYE